MLCAGDVFEARGGPGGPAPPHFWSVVEIIRRQGEGLRTRRQHDIPVTLRDE